MIYRLQRKQLIKSDLESVWDFISSPANLIDITPPYMGFRIIGKDETEKTMYAGQFIRYHVRPVAGIRMLWVTEITHVEKGRYFVDEQRSGPYRLWHHEHFLEETEGGVLMTDIIHYQLPFSFIGRMVNHLFIRHRLNEIFDFRFLKIEAIFGQKQ